MMLRRFQSEKNKARNPMGSRASSSSHPSRSAHGHELRVGAGRLSSRDEVFTKRNTICLSRIKRS